MPLRNNCTQDSDVKVIVGCNVSRNGSEGHTLSVWIQVTYRGSNPWGGNSLSIRLLRNERMTTRETIPDKNVTVCIERRSTHTMRHGQKLIERPTDDQSPYPIVAHHDTASRLTATDRTRNTTA